MAVPNNILQQVQTYQRSGIAFLDNMFCAISLSNKKFNNFQDRAGNLGATVNFDLPPRFSTVRSLTANFQSAQQRLQPLTVDQPFSTSYEFTAEQFIFNVKDYMSQFGKAAVKNIGGQIEKTILQNITSSVPVLVNETPTGALHTESGPYRFAGDGVTPITSYNQLAKFIANFRNYGDAGDTKAILPDTIIPDIIGTGLNQFVEKRNNEIAVDWKLGEFVKTQWHISNLLPTHVSGSVGNAAAPSNVLTVVSTNDPTGANITQLTLSGAVDSDPNAIFSGDLAQFNYGVSGQPNLYYMTFQSQALSSQPVQIRFTANAAATSGGQVTVSIFPPLCSQAGNQNQNILYNIVAGMQLTVMPSHRAGVIWGGDALFTALPRLPDNDPFYTAYESDKDSGISLRYTQGNQFGQNARGTVIDAIMGSSLVPEDSMRILVPLSQ